MEFMATAGNIRLSTLVYELPALLAPLELPLSLDDSCCQIKRDIGVGESKYA